MSEAQEVALALHQMERLGLLMAEKEGSTRSWRCSSTTACGRQYSYCPNCGIRTTQKPEDRHPVRGSPCKEGDSQADQANGQRCASCLLGGEAHTRRSRDIEKAGASIKTATGLAIAGITPRGSLARMVAARSKIKGGRSGECRDRTGADEGASGGKRHRTEQGQKAATHSHTAPCTTCQ